MAGWDDSIFSNLPGSPRRPKPPPPGRGLLEDMFPVDPRQVIGGLVNQATEGAGNVAASGARAVGLPNPDLLGHDVAGFLQSPTFGGGASPMAAAPAILAATPMAMRAARVGQEVAPEARTAEEIATGTRAARAASAARAAQATPGQAALDRMVQQSQAAAPAAASVAQQKLTDWVSSGKPVRMFHGTADPQVQSIKEAGLKPGGGIGADTWAEKARMPVSEFRSRDPSVFLTDSPDAAQMYASKAMAAQPGPIGKGAILSIDIPPEFARNLVPDEMAHGTFGGPAEYSFRYPGAIPPEWVKPNYIRFPDDPPPPGTTLNAQPNWQQQWP